MILATLLAAAPMVAQNPIDATLDPRFQVPPARQGSGQSGRATSACDDFNRANNTNMGGDWSEVAGNIEVLNNQGHGVTNLSMMTHTSASDAYSTSTMTAKFDTAGGLVYVTMVAGYNDISNNVFVKVQDNTSNGDYDRVFFYYGNNGGPWAGNTGYYFDLATPTISGTMTLSFSGGGDVAVLEIDNDTSGVTETFTCGGLLGSAGGLGNGFGIGTYGGCYFDDWSVNGGCAGLDLTTTGTPGTFMTFDYTGAPAGATVALIYAFGTGSFSVPGGFPCTGTALGLATPQGWVVTFADGAGNGTHGQNVPQGAAGRVFVQALETTGCTTSNVVAL